VAGDKGRVRGGSEYWASPSAQSNLHVLLTLAQAGVASLNVGYKSGTTTDVDGNQILQTGSYTKIDGTTAAMDDVWFKADMARTVDENLVAVSDDIAALPDVAGFGNVHSLQQAMVTV